MVGWEGIWFWRQAVSCPLPIPIFFHRAWQNSLAASPGCSCRELPESGGLERTPLPGASPGSFSGLQKGVCPQPRDRRRTRNPRRESFRCVPASALRQGRGAQPGFRKVPWVARVFPDQPRPPTARVSRNNFTLFGPGPSGFLPSARAATGLPRSKATRSREILSGPAACGGATVIVATEPGSAQRDPCGRSRQRDPCGGIKAEGSGSRNQAVRSRERERSGPKALSSRTPERGPDRGIGAAGFRQRDPGSRIRAAAPGGHAARRGSGRAAPGAGDGRVRRSRGRRASGGRGLGPERASRRERANERAREVSTRRRPRAVPG